MRGQSAISKPREKVHQQPHTEGQSSGVEDWEDRGRVEGVGAGTFGCPFVSRDVLKKAKAEGVSRDVSSRPPDVSVAEANAKVARLEGSLAVLGLDDVEERRCLRGGIIEGAGSHDRWRPWGSGWTSARSIANGQ